MNCPKCKSDEFDGWDCQNCNFSIHPKARKAHGRQLTPQEALELHELLFEHDDTTD